MGKSKTQISLYGSTIKAALDSLSGTFGQSHKEEYEQLKDKMNALIHINEILYNTELYLSEKEIKELKEMYNSVAQILGKIETMLDADKNIKEGDEIKEIISNFQDIVAEDNQLMNAIRPNSNLSQAVLEVNDKEIDISDADLGKVGENLSSRIPMTIVSDNGETEKGFFTEETTFDMTREYRNTLARWKEEFGEKAGEFDKIFNGTEEENVQLFCEMIEARRSKFKEFLGEMILSEPSYESLEDLIYKKHPELDDRGTDYEEFNYGFFKAENKEGDSLIDVMWYDLKKLEVSFGMNKDGLGLKQGDNIDKRNAAMSSVAEMLGVSNLIVNSKMMTLEKNGKTIHGTFLPNAEGVDITKAVEEYLNVPDKIDDE